MLPSVAVELPDLQATYNLAALLSTRVEVPQTIALSGTLGAGKTQWTRNFCHALGVSLDSVTSPTYVLQQRYRGTQLEIYHLDFYRLESAQQVWDLGFDELQESQVIVIVEWADKFPETLPADRLNLHMEVTDSGDRIATLKPTGEVTLRWLQAVQLF